MTGEVGGFCERKLEVKHVADQVPSGEKCKKSFFVRKIKGGEATDRECSNTLLVSDFECKNSCFFGWKMRLLATIFTLPQVCVYFECDLTEAYAKEIVWEFAAILREINAYSLPESSLK